MHICHAFMYVAIEITVVESILFIFFSFFKLIPKTVEALDRQLCFF